MITKEELQQLMQQDNAVEAIYDILSKQTTRILELEDELKTANVAISNI